MTNYLRAEINDEEIKFKVSPLIILIFHTFYVYHRHF
jgi:hypothetical protein